MSATEPSAPAGVLDRFDAGLGRASLWLARAGAVVLAVMMVLTFCDVVGRYAFNSPLVGTVETTELFMGLIVFFGMALTAHGDGHISVDLVTARLAGRPRRMLALLAQLAGLGFAFALGWRLFERAGQVRDSNLETQLWAIPVWPVIYAMAAGAALMLLVLVVRLLHTARDLKKSG